jgi:hypothetical protein
MLHRTRHLFIRQQTAVINAIRAHLAELASLRRLGAMVLKICSISSLIAVTNGYPMLHVRALLLLAPNCGC